MKKDKNFFQGHARLAEERGKLWGTQQDAADFFDISRVTWGCYERGEAYPNINVLAGMAQQGADAFYILTGRRDPLRVDTSGHTPVTHEATLLDDYRNSSPEGKAAISAAAKAIREKSADAPAT